MHPANLQWASVVPGSTSAGVHHCPCTGLPEAVSAAALSSVVMHLSRGDRSCCLCQGGGGGGGQGLGGNATAVASTNTAAVGGAGGPNYAPLVGRFSQSAQGSSGLPGDSSLVACAPHVARGAQQRHFTEYIV